MGLLYDAYLPRVFRYRMGRVRSQADAEDLTEDIFLKVIGAVRRFEWRTLGESGRSPFGAWLFPSPITMSSCSTGVPPLAGRRLSFRRPSGTTGAAPRSSPRRSSPSRRCLRPFQRPPEAQREVILLRFGAGLTVAETAEVLGKQQTNVKVLQHKGVQRLKRIMDERARGLGLPLTIDE